MTVMKEAAAEERRRRCELCGGEAAVHCPSDSAFLCWSCDAKVHEANFLVARHIRDVVCFKCKSVTTNRVCGYGVVPVTGFCASCGGDEPDDAVSSSSSSAACVSSSDRRNGGDSSEVSFPARSVVPAKVDEAAEGIFVNWCKRLGIGAGAGEVIRSACGVFRLCTAVASALPLRAVLASALWFSLRRSRAEPASTWKAVMKKLEEISGVPAKLILAGESKLQRLEKAGKQRRRWLEEGWGEC